MPDSNKIFLSPPSTLLFGPSSWTLHFLPPLRMLSSPLFLFCQFGSHPTPTLPPPFLDLLPPLGVSGQGGAKGDGEKERPALFLPPLLAFAPPNSSLAKGRRELWWRRERKGEKRGAPCLDADCPERSRRRRRKRGDEGYSWLPFPFSSLSFRGPSALGFVSGHL